MTRQDNIVNRSLDRLEQYGLRHPVLLALVTMLAAAATTIVLLSQSDAAGILYEGF